VTLRKSSGGVFEISVDGELRFSKRRTGAFPSDGEVLAAVG
jgi:selT/selW/selH-like putative selenoprotein